jgi:hypothetical protein
MKIEITTKNIIITPAPKRNKKKGLKVFFWMEPKGGSGNYPTATADIKKGQRKYSLPEGFGCSIKSIEF